MKKSIFYLPFVFPFIYHFKIPVQSFGSLNLLDIILTINIIAGFYLITKKSLFADFKKFVSSYQKSLWFFLLFATLATLVNLDKNWLHSLSLLKSFFILPVFWVIIINFLVKNNFLNRLTFFYGYFIYSFLLGIFAIIFKFFHLNTFDNRVTLFFNSPNQLAIALALGIITTFFLGIKNHKLFLLALPILILGLFFTQSSGAIIALVILIPVSLFKKPNPFLKFSFLFSIIFSFLLICSPLFIKKFHHNPFENKNSLDSRAVIYLVSSKLILSNFWDGIGPGNFQENYLIQQFNFPPFPQWAIPHSHNLFLQILISFGFPCLIFFLITFYQKITGIKKNSYFPAIFLIYFLIHGLIDTPIWNNDQALFFWFVLLSNNYFLSKS